MATNTYVALAKQTLTSAASSVTFSSINQGYTDLVLVVNQGNDQNTDYDVYVRFNSDSGSNYSRTQLVGNGSTASTSRSTNNTELRMGPSINNTPTSMLTLNIMNYSNSTTYKTTLLRTGHASASTTAAVGLWRNTAAITSVVFTLQGGYNFVAGSTFSLYGIKANTNSESSPKATGGYVSSDSTYWYHAFPYTGSFTPSESLTADILVIAGGGAGGYDEGGGGGAGGYRLLSSQSLTTTGYTCTVGSGGAAVQSISAPGKGTNSSFAGSGFSTITSSGGGGGGTYVTVQPTTGGSGGGGGSNNGVGAAGNAGGYSPVEGYAGGNSGRGGGGGGGAGGAGQSIGSGDGPGAYGGVGSSTASSWGLATGLGQNVSGTVYFAGGGGAGTIGSSGYAGGAGGYGGGGKGMGNNGPSTDGQMATGSGGGAGSGWSTATSRNGGSGLIIVRYAK